MAEQGNKGNGTGGAQMPEGQTPIRAKIVNQYIKDLSFENPNVHKLISSAGDQPGVKVEVNVGAQKINENLTRRRSSSRPPPRTTSARSMYLRRSTLVC